MTQTVQHDDANQVTAESNTAERPTLSVVGVDPELGFGGGETQVLGLTHGAGRAAVIAQS